MAIRRISDLPSLGDGQLSDCVIEVSYKDEKNNYRSCYTYPTKFGEYITEYIADSTLTTLNIEGGSLSISNSDFIVDSPVNITKIYSQKVDINGIEDVSISSSGGSVNINSKIGINIGNDTNGPKVSIKGNPVVINDNLSVGLEYTHTNEKVELRNKNNIIYAESIKDYTAQDNANRVVTCSMLSSTLGYASDIIHQITVGKGVTL